MQYRYLTGKYKDSEELKKHWKQLAMELHPDKGGATEDMQQLNAEFEARLKVFTEYKDYTHDQFSQLIISLEPEIKSVLGKLADHLLNNTDLIPKNYKIPAKMFIKKNINSLDLDDFIKKLNKKK